eukprot:m.171228 g.171228  ORF g.171228 m.171228 type:complete len:440 (-) comp13348_c0_seq1:76-1395(-)
MDAAWELNEERFVTLLGKLIGEAKYVQNQPPKLVPEEDKIINHLLELLEPHSTKNGGPLHIQHIHFKEKRGNLIIEYKSAAPKGTVAFVGSHLDVVPADPEGWERDPFTMSVEGDKLYGRGTTDCLGHVALLTDMFLQLAEKKPALDVTVFGCFIASEENSSIPEVGVDMVLKAGYLDSIKDGPVFWIDSADSEPCLGTAAAIQWSIRAEGKLFHSGLPHKGINALELCQDAVTEIQRRFYKDFPPCEAETKYKFATPSTMKPTKVSSPDNAVNQVPPWCTMEGDIRLTPFYTIEAVQKAMEGYVADINANITTFSQPRGTVAKYEITEEDGNVLRGKVELEWKGEPFRGIACSLDSPGHHALVEAHTLVRGEAKPYAICGSLPLVGDLQDAGFDLQISGYGKSSVYHGDNEYCSLSDMKDALKILTQIIVILNKKFAA